MQFVRLFNNLIQRIVPCVLLTYPLYKFFVPRLKPAESDATQRLQQSLSFGVLLVSHSASQNSRFLCDVIMGTPTTIFTLSDRCSLAACSNHCVERIPQNGRLGDDNLGSGTFCAKRSTGATLGFSTAQKRERGGQVPLLPQLGRHF